MSKFTERHQELIALVKLGKLTSELRRDTFMAMELALLDPTPEAVDEVLRVLREFELVNNDWKKEMLK